MLFSKGNDEQAGHIIWIQGFNGNSEFLFLSANAEQIDTDTEFSQELGGISA